MATIYVVEDDQNIREIESFALKNAGFEVEDFECAAAFYKRMERVLPDLILLDHAAGPGRAGDLKGSARPRGDETAADHYGDGEDNGDR